ncbi:hypothetical protein LTR94_036095, partial [Friedmanniomyces endolithicus]
RGGRPEGPGAGHRRRPDQLRQGLGADGDPAARRPGRRPVDHHGALLHAVGPLDPEDRHRAGPGGRSFRGRGAHRLALQLHLFRGGLFDGAGLLHRGRAEGTAHPA